jgi:DNA-binding CsgD family transcriptional regulator
MSILQVLHVSCSNPNTEIGIELWISQASVKQALKRMFRELSVSARTEMVAKLEIIVMN